MSYSQDIRVTKPLFEAYTTSAAGLTGEIDLEGGTLAGVLLESDITSTSFTITVARVSGGTFVTTIDGTGQVTGTPGATITYTIPATATGYYPISPLLTAGFRFCKVQLGSSEAITLYASKRNLQ